MKKMFTQSLLTAAVAAAVAMPAQAYNLSSSDAGEVNLDVEAIFGVFSSEETYNTVGGNTGESRDWQEAYIKAGFSGFRNLDNGAQVYGGINALFSGTWGDGDPAGFTTGDEREIDLEDAYIGYRNDMIDFSVGRQNLSFGDGFLINGDALNLGEGLGDEFDRGGAYWLAGRKAFDKTAMLRVGGDSGLRSDLFWFESDNVAQAKPEMAGINVEYVTETGTFGAMYLNGLDVEQGYGYDHRDGQDTFSLRYQGSAGVENLFLSGEFVTQNAGDNSADGDAWYVEAGWTFADVAWTPSVNYRYSTFDEGFDPLFFGFNRGYGTWFQGEVAANYAGPFNSDTDVHHIALKAAPTETLAVGALFFDFSGTAGDAMDGQEIDLYAEWVVNDNLIISPLLGFYTPDSAGSTQGNDDTNTYFQVLAIVPF
ncbi:hypothetical protein [Neptuniibacter halophilus]|uniref:hypothetical protein n=1 Tax=Neptuniibacter halophilus TaxID=651666 RepID=UPI002573ABAD|nr:hypothetical protein [Neptuniibacter halophilus]